MVEPIESPAMDAAAWRRASATRAALVVDAADYFAAARLGMLQARRRIMLIGWDFDARIQLADSATRLQGEPRTLGDFVLWLVDRNPELEVCLLRWNIGALRTLFRGTTLFTVIRWMAHPRIHTRLDAASTPGAAHHHKIVVIDDRLAFCGGIDMTSNRWDTPAHLDDDPRRIMPNGVPYGPWHDSTMALQGPAAAALGELARERWREAGGHALAPVPPLSSESGEAASWPEGLTPHFRHVSVTISRSRPATAGGTAILEVEETFLAEIAAARRYIFAESQYFAARRIAEAMAERLAEADGPEIVLITPERAHGWLEPVAMDTARARLVEVMRHADAHGRFRLYHPVTAAGRPIYVHAKVLIVDDRVLHVGSSNMNNRSLRLDTECDVVIDATSTANAPAAPAIGAAISGLRDRLLGEHLGFAPATVRARIEAEGSLIAAIEALRGEGRSLRPYQVPALNDIETWLADNELLDPEGPEEIFKPLSQRGLLRRLRYRFRRPRGRSTRHGIPDHELPARS
ncbi:phospholipase D-like domain-containing protein [Reyranella sp.]|uniref:phospholipase D-like domain-containing protein n=1 Tax=Reyranella sp. TaxID=1929291 RepID=UPI003D150523